jgi:hypothetical protein
MRAQSVGHDRCARAGIASPCIFTITMLLLLQGSAAFNIPMKPMPILKANHRMPALRSMSPTMTTAFITEGLQHGYHLFEFVGRRLPRQFFTELGTPEHSSIWIALFLLSNIAFPIAGVKILATRERPNRKLAFFVFLVGAISTAFHWTQCSLGSGSPVVHTWSVKYHQEILMGFPPRSKHHACPAESPYRQCLVHMNNTII